MAWIQKRRSGFLVCWREDGRKRSRLVHSPEEAADLKAHLEAQDRAERVLAGVAGIPGWDGPGAIGRALDEDFADERAGRPRGVLRRTSDEPRQRVPGHR